MSFGEQRQGNDLVYRFKLNSSVSSLEAIRVEQLGAIDGVLLKENSFIREKSDILPGNGFCREISLIIANEKSNCVIANGPT